jgi:hypothetical protein
VHWCKNAPRLSAPSGVTFSRKVQGGDRSLLFVRDRNFLYSFPELWDVIKWQRGLFRTALMIPSGTEWQAGGGPPGSRRLQRRCRKIHVWFRLRRDLSLQ